MDLLRFLHPFTPSHVPVHCVPHPLAHYGSSLRLESPVLLDRYRGDHIPSVAHLCLAQHHQASPDSIKTLNSLADLMYRKLNYEFFKFMHFAAVIVFMIVLFWHCDYTLTSWYPSLPHTSLDEFIRLKLSGTTS